MINKLINISGVGEVLFRKSAKAKRINISVHPEKGAVVAVPLNCTYDEAARFALIKADWIVKSLEKLKEVTANQTVFTPQTNFVTKYRKLVMAAQPRNNVRLNVTSTSIEIAYPEHIKPENENLQQAVRRAIEHVWKIEANEYLPDRIKHLADINNFKYSELTIKSAKTFWGKCFSNNNITLNIHLMHLPDELIDYVILHELCHTIHKNHGKHFKALLRTVTNGKSQLLEKEIKKHSTRYF